MINFLVITVDSKVTKNGKPYGLLRVYLSDDDFKHLKTVNPSYQQEMDVYCWSYDPNTSSVKIKPGDVIKFSERAIEHGESSFYSTRDIPTIVISGITDETRKLYSERLEKLCPKVVTIDDVHSLLSKVDSWTKEHYKNKEQLAITWSEYLVSWLHNTLDEIYAKYSKMPAAKRNHHAYSGGLMNHTFQILDMLIHIYPSFNKVTHTNLLYAFIGALFHDYGKLQEYTESGEYILENLCMLGHPFMSSAALSNSLNDLALTMCHETNASGEDLKVIRSEITKIVHIVLSHHAVADHKEWGSPVTPHSPEALLVSNLDYLSGYGDKFNLPSNDNFYPL